jgi:hypothetical protein
MREELPPTSRRLEVHPKAEAHSAVRLQVDPVCNRNGITRRAGQITITPSLPAARFTANVLDPGSDFLLVGAGSA